jgi:predicted amino acid racemase
LPADPQAKTSRQSLRLVLAVGRQDIDPAGLVPIGQFRIIGTSSDHLVITTNDHQMTVGSEIGFQVDYASVLRAMTSPYVTKKFVKGAVKTRLQECSAWQRGILHT